MKFYLVDRIEQLERPGRIVGTKCLTSAEEYLADHFPAFPVMPGVMMLEACVQTAAWLVRLETDWSVSTIVLRQARNVRYASFVAPGDTMTVEAELKSLDLPTATFHCVGRVGDTRTVQAKIELNCFNLAEVGAAGAEADQRIIEQMKRRWRLVGGEALVAGI